MRRPSKAVSFVDSPYQAQFGQALHDVRHLLFHAHMDTAIFCQDFLKQRHVNGISLFLLSGNQIEGRLGNKDGNFFRFSVFRVTGRQEWSQVSLDIPTRLVIEGDDHLTVDGIGCAPR